MPTPVLSRPRRVNATILWDQIAALVQAQVRRLTRPDPAGSRRTEPLRASCRPGWTRACLPVVASTIGLQFIGSPAWARTWTAA
jgi:hypothetical protein